LVNLFEEAHKIDFDYVFNCNRHEKIEKNSGRIEKRSLAITSETSDLSTAEDWKDSQTVIEVINETTSVKGEISREKRYYISKLKKLGMAKVRQQAKWNEDGTVMKKLSRRL